MTIAFLALTPVGSAAANGLTRWRRHSPPPAAAPVQPDPAIDQPGPVPTIVWRLTGDGRGTPATDGGNVYFLSRTHDVIAVVSSTGSIRWRQHLPLPGSTYGAAIVSLGTTLAVGDEDVFGVDKGSGRVLWRFGPGEVRGAGPYLGEAGGDRVFVGSPAGHLYALDTRGRTIWAASIGTGKTTVFSPVTDGSLVVAGFATSSPSSSAAGIVAVDVRTGRERWRVDLGPGPFGGGPLLGDQEVIAARADGRLIGVSAATGALRWTLPAAAGRQSAYDFRPIVRVQRLLIAGSLGGVVTAYDLRTLTKRWTYTDLEASVAFGLAADQKTVFVPFMSGHLVALDARSGIERWRIGGMRESFAWVPLVAGRRVYAAATGAGFFALAN